MKRLVLLLAAVALTACADSASHRLAAPKRPSLDVCRNGYMVAYDKYGNPIDSTYTGCGGGQ